MVEEPQQKPQAVAQSVAPWADWIISHCNVALLVFIAVAAVFIVYILFRIFRDGRDSEFKIPFIAKLMIWTMEALCGTPAILIQFENPDSTHNWLKTGVLAFSAIFLFRLFGFLYDYKESIDKKNSESLVEAINSTASSVLEAVKVKLGNLTTAIQESNGAALVKIREGLTQDDQLRLILEKLGVSIRLAKNPKDRVTNLRVAIFHEINQVMVCVTSVSLGMPHDDPISSTGGNPGTGPNPFHINSQNQAEVCKCAVNQAMYIVPSCSEASKRNKFLFTSPHQESYLKSMVVWPCGIAYSTLPNKTKVVLAVDADINNYFLESDKATLKLIFREFYPRVLLELAVKNIFES